MYVQSYSFIDIHRERDRMKQREEGELKPRGGKKEGWGEMNEEESVNKSSNKREGGVEEKEEESVDNILSKSEEGRRNKQVFVSLGKAEKHHFLLMSDVLVVVSKGEGGKEREKEGE